MKCAPVYKGSRNRTVGGNAIFATSERQCRSRYIQCHSSCHVAKTTMAGGNSRSRVSSNRARHSPVMLPRTWQTTSFEHKVELPLPNRRWKSAKSENMCLSTSKTCCEATQVIGTLNTTQHFFGNLRHVTPIKPLRAVTRRPHTFSSRYKLSWI